MSTSLNFPDDVGGDCRTFINENEKIVYERTEENVSLLYKAWSDLLGVSTDQIRLNRLHVPRAPHLQDCKLSSEMNHRLDTRLPNGTFPPWTVWKGLLDYLPLSPIDEQLKQYRDHVISQGAYPPWV